MDSVCIIMTYEPAREKTNTLGSDHVAKTKALISFAVCWFSHAAAHI